MISAYKISHEKNKKIDLLPYLRADGKIILKLILQK
jgi:hypothetical protein